MSVRKTCPYCREYLTFEGIGTFRVYREVDGVYIYRAKCPKCGDVDVTTKRKPPA